MSKTVLYKTVKITSSALIVAALLSLSILARASTPAKAAPAAPAKPSAAKPAVAVSARPGVTTGGAAAAHPGGFPGATANHSIANKPVPTTLPTSTPKPVPGPAGKPTDGGPKTAPHFQSSIPHGGGETVSHKGDIIRTRPGGGRSDIHVEARGMDIHHGLNGGNRVMVERADHSRTVFERGRPGYTQRPYGYGGRDFARRTYVYNGHSYNRFYRGYAYRGMHLSVYAPGVYYSPGYYGWAYRPWGAPVAYQWGFAASPWYGYYANYYTPSPVYSSPSQWLTDYMISSDLQRSYAAHTDGGEADSYVSATGSGPTLSPDVKQQVAEEVRNQLALENQEAQQNLAKQDVDPGSSGIDRMVRDGHSHVFVVGNPLDAVDGEKNSCLLSDGDVLSLHVPTPIEATTGQLVVLASKGGRECKINGTVTVVMEDLQEMQNHMRESIDQGLKELHAKQGKDGIPAVPSTALAAPVQAQYAAIAPPEDPDASAQIQQQSEQAAQAEKEVTAEAGPSGSGQ